MAHDSRRREARKPGEMMDRGTLVKMGMDVHFLAPARGKVLMSEGKVRKVGRKTAFADAEVFNEDGAIAAVARCTIMLAEKAR